MATTDVSGLTQLGRETPLRDAPDGLWLPDQGVPPTRGRG